MVFLIVVVLLPLILSGPARLRRRWRVIAVSARRKRLVPYVARLWVRVIMIMVGRWGIIAVTLWLRTAVFTVALRFRLSVVIGDGWQSVLLDVAICLAEATFSLMEGAQFRQGTG